MRVTIPESRENPPTFPDVFYEVVRDGVIAREEGEPDRVIGCTVVGTTVIRGQRAKSVVEVERPLELELRTDEAIINVARPGLHESLRELADSKA